MENSKSVVLQRQDLGEHSISLPACQETNLTPNCPMEPKSLARRREKSRGLEDRRLRCNAWTTDAPRAERWQEVSLVSWGLGPFPGSKV